jgi:hypothetical protein
MGYLRSSRQPHFRERSCAIRTYTEAIPVLTPLSRYERQIERSLQEAQKELETLQYANQLHQTSNTGAAINSTWTWLMVRSPLARC